MLKNKIILPLRLLCILLLTLMTSSCKGQETENSTKENIHQSNQPDNENSAQNSQPLVYNQSTYFPQTHSNLNGMVSEFVRKIYQDSKGIFWFGTNGDGLIRYDGKTLESFSKKEGIGSAIRGIKEDKDGNIWFGTSSGLTKYNGNSFTNYSLNEGLISEEIWAIDIDTNGTIWVGTVGGLSKFDGNKFETFEVPKEEVENAIPMLSEKRIGDILIDKKGDIWFSTDGYGISKYNGTSFEFLTKENGLTDNNVADIFEDSQGNIWIGTFYGGVSKYDGNSFTNFTKDGIIDGIETYNFCEDNHGNIWFSAENFGVYKHDGTKFTQFTKEDGLATNTIQSIFEDNKGQIWFGTWEGISLYDGKTFMDVSDKEPWTK